MALPTVTTKRWARKVEATYTYRYLNAVLLREGDDLRALTRYLYFENWDHLLTLMLEGLELEIPPNTS